MASTGNIFSKIFLSPPTKIAIFPVEALWHPPLTGPSKGIAFFSITFLPSLLTSASSVVLISSQILFSERPFINPSSLSMTSAHISGEGRQVMIRSTCFANSLGEFATLAPNFSNLLVKFLSKSLTVKSNLFLNKLPANLPPTFPSPIKPIFIIISLILMIIQKRMIYLFLKNALCKNRT